MELWRASEQPHLQEPISPGEEPAPPGCGGCGGPSVAGRGERVGSCALPPLPCPLSREIRVGIT